MFYASDVDLSLTLFFIQIFCVIIKIMQKYEENQDKEVFVTMILSESTTSLLKLNIPHLENIDPDNSMVCVIKASQQYGPHKDQTNENGDEKPSTSKENKSLEQLYLKISSDIGLFNQNNSSSTSLMYGKFTVEMLFDYVV